MPGSGRNGHTRRAARRRRRLERSVFWSRFAEQSGDVRRGPFLEQPHELGIEEQVAIRDIEADDVLNRSVRREALVERALLMVIHREDYVGPLEHPLVDDDERARLSTRRPHVERGMLAEDALRGGAAAPVLTADEENVE